MSSKASLVCIGSLSSAKAAQWDPVSKPNRTNKTKQLGFQRPALQTILQGTHGWGGEGKVNQLRWKKGRNKRTVWKLSLSRPCSWQMSTLWSFPCSRGRNHQGSFSYYFYPPCVALTGLELVNQAGLELTEIHLSLCLCLHSWSAGPLRISFFGAANSPLLFQMPTESKL